MGADSSTGTLAPEELSEFLNETAMSVEEQAMNPEARQFEEQQEALLDDLEAMAQEAAGPRRQVTKAVSPTFSFLAQSLQFPS